MSWKKLFARADNINSEHTGLEFALQRVNASEARRWQTEVCTLSIIQEILHVREST